MIDGSQNQFACVCNVVRPKIPGPLKSRRVGGGGYDDGQPRTDNLKFSTYANFFPPVCQTVPTMCPVLPVSTFKKPWRADLDVGVGWWTQQTKTSQSPSTRPDALLFPPLILYPILDPTVFP